MPQHRVTRAVESWIPDEPGPVLLTCDHASARMPAPWRWPAQDLSLVGTHWSYDLGAAELTRALSVRLGAAALWSRFSRLLVDPNRELSQDSLIVDRAGDHRVALNQGLTQPEREARISGLYEPYHAAIDEAVRAHRQRHARAWLLSVHTFTPVYRGQARALQGGVLFDRHEQLGREFCTQLQHKGWDVRENEPYSGYDGLIDGVARHGLAHDCPYVELELRQDLAVCPRWRERAVRDLAAVCERLSAAML